MTRNPRFRTIARIKIGLTGTGFIRDWFNLADSLRIHVTESGHSKIPESHYCLTVSADAYGIPPKYGNFSSNNCACHGLRIMAGFLCLLLANDQNGTIYVADRAISENQIGTNIFCDSRAA